MLPWKLREPSSPRMGKHGHDRANTNPIGQRENEFFLCARHVLDICQKSVSRGVDVKECNWLTTDQPAIHICAQPRDLALGSQPDAMPGANILLLV